MGPRKRDLLAYPAATTYSELEQRATALAAKYPEAAPYSEEEIAEFTSAANMIDLIEPRALVKALRRARIRFPPHLQLDTYRLGRHLLSRWNDPDLRKGVLSEVIRYDHRKIVKVCESPDLPPILEFVTNHSPLVAFWLMRQVGMAERIPEVIAAFSEDLTAWYRGSLLCGRVLMHRYQTEPDLLDTQPTRTEQKEIIRRIRKRDIQLSSMRKSLYTLGIERKNLIARVRQAERAAQAELDALIAQLEQIRRDTAAAEIHHGAAIAELARKHAAETEALQTQIAASLQDFTEALAERNVWAPGSLLSGSVVAVVGDEAREAGYRALVESAGGRMLHLSAVEKLNRIPDAVAGADVVILMTAHAKHQADHLLRKSISPDTLVLRCPKVGLASFERLLRTEVLPRLVLRQSPPPPPGGHLHERLAVPSASH